jgi:hypothetical protein
VENRLRRRILTTLTHDISWFIQKLDALMRRFVIILIGLCASIPVGMTDSLAQSLPLGPVPALTELPTTIPPSDRPDDRNRAMGPRLHRLEGVVRRVAEQA